MTDAFDITLEELERSADRPERFSSSFLAVLPVTGAAVSTVGRVIGSETVSATDDVAARLDELQFDLGEGPCWEVVGGASFVAEPDFRSDGARRWPRFVAAGAARDEIASMFALPLVVGDLRFGAVDLYSRSKLALDDGHIRQATALAEIIGRHVLRDALSSLEADTPADAKPYSRRVVHQATGIVLAQLGLSPEDALLVIQAHAFGTGASALQVSKDIVEGRLRFVRQESGIEAAT
ncbi:GAF and ANTAR domain-containing protein [Microbacterium sp. CFH 90308]|uniref:GAF and ANTAR domain-containing protein n=1 Tax=Microbacterium salsuginis TaxID=2722803 RepID=A0ABX1K5I2_9MICO|nr:GAF and ANTAR domain-containing protein [Microbacterium sp. CFH 90308]NLP82259.1 GAF and ANTAR domain-containing protein [Microbacterium sp. CFH 90308]